MKRALGLLATVGLAIGLTSCGGGEPAKDAPCAATVRWSRGSMPPPHSYAWIVTFDESGRGSVTMTNNYESMKGAPKPLFEEKDVSFDQATQHQLCAALRDLPATEDRPRVGGQMLSWTISAPGEVKGTSTDPEAFGPTWELVQALIGAQRLAKGDVAYQGYVDENR